MADAFVRGSLTKAQEKEAKRITIDWRGRMREIRQSGSEGGEPQYNATSLPLSLTFVGCVCSISSGQAGNSIAGLQDVCLVVEHKLLWFNGIQCCPHLFSGLGLFLGCHWSACAWI
jgi:hypothetical protein